MVSCSFNFYQGKKKNQFAYQPIVSIDTECKLNVDVNRKTFFLRMLDAHNVGHEAGVPEEVFKVIFYICPHCGQYMTQRVAFNHVEDAEFTEGDDAMCIFMGTGAAGHVDDYE